MRESDEKTRISQLFSLERFQLDLILWFSQIAAAPKDGVVVA